MDPGQIKEDHIITFTGRQKFTVLLYKLFGPLDSLLFKSQGGDVVKGDHGHSAFVDQYADIQPHFIPV